MHAEETEMCRKVHEERIAAFSGRALPGGQVPTLPSEALAFLALGGFLVGLHH